MFGIMINRQNMSRVIVSYTTDRKPGGISSSLVSYSQAMAIANIQHIIILPSLAYVPEELKALDNVRIIPCATSRMRFDLATRFAFNLELRRQFNAAGRVFIHNAKHIPAFSWLGRRALAVNHTGKTRFLERIMDVVFLNKSVEGRFKKSFPSYQGKTRVIHHAFDLQGHAYHARNSTRPVSVICAGRLLIKKGVGDLIEAARILQERDVNCIIRLVGAGEDELLFSQTIKDYGLKNIKILPWSNNLAADLLAADIFCSPSHGESFGLVMGEAMRASLPIVSTQTDGATEYVEQCEALFCLMSKVGDYVGLADNIEKLAVDDELRSQFSRNAFEMISQHFSLDRLAQDFEGLLNDFSG